MTWPASDVNNTNTTSAGTAGQPAAFRADANDLITKFNQLRNHVTSFMQTLLNRSTAALARADLEIAKYYWTLDTSATRTTSGDFASFTATAGQNNTGHDAAAGTFTAPVAGLYTVTATVTASGTFSGSVGNKYILGYLKLNGSAIGVGGVAPYPVASEDVTHYMSFSATIKLAASDVLKVAVDHNAAGITAQCTRFTGVFIG